MTIYSSIVLSSVTLKYFLVGSLNIAFAFASALDLEIMMQSSTYRILKLAPLVNIQVLLDVALNPIDYNPSVRC